MFTVESNNGVVISIDPRGNVTVGKYDQLDIANIVEYFCGLAPASSTALYTQLAMMRLLIPEFTPEFDRTCPEETVSHEK